MLPGYSDCGRRAATKQFRHLIHSAGFELRALLPSVGAAVGTAAHAVVAAVQRQRREGQDVTADVLRAGLDGALTTFREEIKPGAEWDDTTPNLLIAEAQIEQMARVAIVPALRREPAEIELPLRASIQANWELTGTIDELDRDGHLDDLKTGAVRRPYNAQLGAYALLARSNGLHIKDCGTTFVQRARKSKPQPPADYQPYNLADAERAAWKTVEAVVRDVEAFKASGDPFVFPANPMSLMCSRRYCPAHGTTFCTMHLPSRAVSIDVD